MIRLIPFFLLFVIMSCSKPTGIREFVSNSDSVVINYFKGDGSMDTVYKVAVVRDKKQINDIATQIESSAVQQSQCGLDGSLHFFKDNMVLQDVDFRMNVEKCMH
ncbi:MAG TPA: hypothetical protein VKH37_01960, partial [Ferruginibacter sp.]|nr:hypothetical protein [Ferruginibacter sp.]